MKYLNLKRIIFIVALTLLIYIFGITYFDIQGVFHLLKDYSSNIFLLILLAVLISQVFMFLRFLYYLKTLRIKSSFKDNVLIYFSSWAMFFAPAKSGELIKSFLLKKIYDIPYRSSTPIILMEQLCDLIVVIFFICFGLVLGFFNMAFFWLIVILILILSIIFLFSNKSFLIFLLRTVNKINFFKKFQLQDTFYAINHLVKPKRLIVALLLSFGYWFCASTVLYLVVVGFNGNISLIKALFAFPASIIIGLLSTIPGGIGVTEGSLFALLKSQGISGMVASASVIVTRIFTLWLGAIVGIFALLKLNGKLNGKLNSNK
jgi:glycosyltransferase 2 family protein